MLIEQIFSVAMFRMCFFSLHMYKDTEEARYWTDNLEWKLTKSCRKAERVMKICIRESLTETST